MVNSADMCASKTYPRAVVLEGRPQYAASIGLGARGTMPHGTTHDFAARPEAAVTAALGRRSIVLVGMMGAGKSSIGRRVALRLGIPFIDADAEIEKAAGMSISDIFAIRGEAEFRAGETRVIARLLESGPQVLATGGGAFVNPETRAAVAAKGISIWLKADFDVLLKRIRRRHDRPLRTTERFCAWRSPMTAPLRASDPTLVNVALGERSYDIIIGRGQLASLGQRLRSEEHTSELQSRVDLVCRLLLE